MCNTKWRTNDIERVFYHKDLICQISAKSKMLDPERSVGTLWNVSFRTNMGTVQPIWGTLMVPENLEFTAFFRTFAKTGTIIIDCSYVQVY